MERKLAAILSADVSGYSRLMGEDEVGTIQTLTAHRAVTDSLIQQHHGRVVNTAGDSILAEFASAVDAVQCAVDIQHALKANNADLSLTRQMEFRIGINVGDVVVRGEELYGDGVNIAARLQALADIGGVFISGTVYDQVKNKLALRYEDLGQQMVKNIAEPVRVFRVAIEVPSPLVGEGQGEGAVQDSASQKAKVKGQKAKVEDRRRMRLTRQILVGLVLIAGVIAAVHYIPFSAFRNPQSPIRNQAALPLPDKPSIVVLPFVNISKDPEQDYFSNGITEVLTSDLSRISSLFVIARNTAFTYQGKAVNVQDIGKELGVHYVLEGSVQKAGEQVRIVAQLIDTTTGSHIWSERYDRSFKDIFALQDEIVQKIVTTLKLQLTLQEQGWIVRKRTDNLEAYDYVLRGVDYFWRSTKESLAQARQMYEKAIALDPQYAEAHAWLGVTYYREWIWRWSADPQTLERALTLAQRATALDDALPVAHSLLGLSYVRKQQYDQAIAEGERAIALDPNNADSYAWQAEVLNVAGRSERALKMVEQAMRLNPRYPFYYLTQLGVAYHLTGRYAEAVATMKEAINRSPAHPGALFYLVHSYVSQWAFQQGADAHTLEEAFTAAQRVITLNDISPWGHAVLGYVYLWQKQYEQASAEMERAIGLDPNLALSHALLAETWSRTNKREEALYVVERALHCTPRIVDEHLSSVGVAYSLAGKPEEAIAPLRRYLSHYVNHLGTHLTLAAVYSELGKDAEAQAEAAEVLRINPKFSLEVHKERVPIKDPATLERHIAVLRKAGLK
jgi:adenylate cyclase